MKFSSVTWWWIRHAAISKSNISDFIGWTDPEIIVDNESTHAVRQLYTELPIDSFIITSDLLRTSQTTDMLQQFTRYKEIIKDRGMREQNFGEWENHSYTEVAHAFPHKYSQFWEDIGHCAPPNGESFQDVTTRVSKSIEHWNSISQFNNIICVAHAGTIRAAIGHALSLTPAKCLLFDVNHLSLSKIEYYENNNGCKIHCINQRYYAKK